MSKKRKPPIYLRIWFMLILVVIGFFGVLIVPASPLLWLVGIVLIVQRVKWQKQQSQEAKKKPEMVSVPPMEAKQPAVPEPIMPEQELEPVAEPEPEILPASAPNVQEEVAPVEDSAPDPEREERMLEPEPEPEKTKVEKHKVAGVSYRKKEIESLGLDNYFYDESTKELAEDCMTDERIYQYDFVITSVELVEEPDNEADPNAVKVILDGTHVGYIKAGSCKHIKKLLREGRIRSMQAEVYGGKYKIVYEDEDYVTGKIKYKAERGQTNYGVALYLTVDL